jgi:hypothetical protein
VQSRVKGSFADLQNVSGDGFEPEADGPPVQGLQCQDFQEEQIESALNEIVWFAHIGFLGEYIPELLSVSKGKLRGAKYGALGVLPANLTLPG